MPIITLPDGNRREYPKPITGLDNFGLYRVERLPGNIGFIDIRYFHRVAWGGDTAIAAMNFLSNASAMIIDLRNCTGGYPAMIDLMSSYFFGKNQST